MQYFRFFFVLVVALCSAECDLKDFEGVYTNLGLSVMGSNCSESAQESGCYVDFFGDRIIVYGASQDGVKIHAQWTSMLFSVGSAMLFVLAEDCDTFSGCYRDDGDTEPLQSCDEVSSYAVLFPLEDPDEYFMSCEHYCYLTFFRCFEASQLFGDFASCLSACSNYQEGTKQDTSGNTRGCRINHLEMAWDNAAVHCLSGAPSGGDACVSDSCPSSFAVNEDYKKTILRNVDGVPDWDTCCYLCDLDYKCEKFSYRPNRLLCRLFTANAVPIWRRYYQRSLNVTLNSSLDGGDGVGYLMDFINAGGHLVLNYFVSAVLLIICGYNSMF